MATAFLKQRANASKLGVSIIKDLLTRKTFTNPNFSPQGFTTTQLYRLAVKEPVPKSYTPYPLELKEVPKPRGPQPPQAAAPTEVHPPHPEHPIRSIRFLKTVILPRLEDGHFIKSYRKPRVAAVQEVDATKGKKKKAQQKSPKADFLWKLIRPQPRKDARTVVPKFTKGWQVGVGLDISHLNKRRQRARLGKVKRDFSAFKALQRRSTIDAPSPMTAKAP